MKLSNIPKDTYKNTFHIEAEPQEKIVVSFDPDGINRNPHSEKHIQFTIEPIIIGNGRLALALLFNDNLYQNKSDEFNMNHIQHWGALFLLDDANDADTLEFPDQLLKLEKIRKLEGGFYSINDNTKESDDQALRRITEMCEESCSPDQYETWLSLKSYLYETRKSLK